LICTIGGGGMKNGVSVKKNVAFIGQVVADGRIKTFPLLLKN